MDGCTVGVSGETEAVVNETEAVYRPGDSVVLVEGEHTQGFKIICDNCSREAIKSSSQARFCGDDCRQEWHNSHRNEKLEEQGEDRQLRIFE